MGEQIYKLATEPWEFEAIYRLNYETFVHEIPQHSTCPDKETCLLGCPIYV